jgi:hypothetical protein
MRRVTKIAESGKYSCLVTQFGSSAEIRNCPLRFTSSSAAKTLGELKCGQQYQPIVPSVVTRGAACRWPISPWLVMGG